MQLTLKQYQQFQTSIYEDRQIEWHAFLIAAEKELQEANKIVCEPQQISFFTKQNKEYIYQFKGNMIRKKTSKGGHQPVLMEVLSAEFSQQNQIITIQVEFTQHQTYRGELYLQEKDSSTKRRE